MGVGEAGAWGSGSESRRGKPAILAPFDIMGSKSTPSQVGTKPGPLCGTRKHPPTREMRLKGSSGHGPGGHRPEAAVQGREKEAGLAR